jgi:hypothetical protein
MVFSGKKISIIVCGQVHLTYLYLLYVETSSLVFEMFQYCHIRTYLPSILALPKVRK